MWIDDEERLKREEKYWAEAENFVEWLAMRARPLAYEYFKYRGGE